MPRVSGKWAGHKDGIDTEESIVYEQERNATHPLAT